MPGPVHVVDGAALAGTHGRRLVLDLPGTVRALVVDLSRPVDQDVEDLTPLLDGPRPLGVAAAAGDVRGRSLALLLSCPLRVLAPDSRLVVDEPERGDLPAAHVVDALVAGLGRGPALDVLLTGRALSAQEGLARGLVVAVDPDPLAAAQDLAAAVGAVDAHVAGELLAQVRASTRNV